MSAVRQPRDLRGRFGESARHDPGTGVLAGEGQDDAGLWGLVDSGDPSAERSAAMSLDLTEEQASALARPDRPFTSRLALASRPDPHAARLAAADPDPVVRARALQAGVGLDAGTRARLEDDPQVTHVRRLLGLPAA